MNKWERMSQDSSFRQAYEAREKALMDEAAKFAYAEQKGLKKGKCNLFVVCIKRNANRRYCKVYKFTYRRNTKYFTSLNN